MKTPKHVALIMDGNRRWARAKNLPTIEGHRKGYQTMREVPGWFFDLNVNIVTVYAFSTENWNRSEEEVGYLMKLMKLALSKDFNDFNKKGIKLLISGRINELPNDLPQICQDAMDKTKNNTKGVLNICLNYGGRAEIVDAVKNIIQDNIDINKIDEKLVTNYLYQGDLPDPDMIVRTSNEQRLSGFQLWESSYSELLFIEKNWPDFNKEDAQKIVEEYSKRDRRKGGN